jgi:hypothetical protein
MKTVTQGFLSFAAGGSRNFPLATDDGGAATITGFTGDVVTADLDIPATVEYGGVSYPITAIGRKAFYNCSGLTSLTLPDSLTKIGDYAFSYCSGLTGELILPDSLTKISDYVFRYCSGLTSVAFPARLTKIGCTAFYSCCGLTGDLTFPESLTTIGTCAFDGCSGLRSLTFPESLTDIGKWAFHNCSGLTSVTLQSITPPSLANLAFSGINPDCVFTCPEEARKAYLADEAWAPYFDSSAAIQAVTGGRRGSPVALYTRCGQLLGEATVRLPASPSALRSVFGVPPADFYLLSTPAGVQEVKL